MNDIYISTHKQKQQKNKQTNSVFLSMCVFVF